MGNKYHKWNFSFLCYQFFVIVRGKKESKRQIHDANTMVLNHLRGYVVDNGLPSQKIIEAVKHSIMREYNIKYTDLLSTKELCEELIKDIIGNIYISNDNKKIYISMLEKYLEQNKDINDDYENPIEKEHSGHVYEYISTVISIIAGIVTAMGVSLNSIIDNIIDITEPADISILIIFMIGVILSIVIAIIFYFISRKKK